MTGFVCPKCTTMRECAGRPRCQQCGMLMLDAGAYTEAQRGGLHE